MQELMTADEITQLLLDRNIVFLFNENVLCPEHDELTNLLKNIPVVTPVDTLKEINTSDIPKLSEQEKNPLHFPETPEEELEHVPKDEEKLRSVLNILNDIKKSDTSYKIFLFDFGIIDLFHSLLFPDTIAAFKQYDLPSDTIVEELKNQLENHYAQGYPSFKNKTFNEIKFIMSKVNQWDEFVSAILQCKNIRTINYHPNDPQEIKKYYEGSCKEEDNFSHWNIYEVENYASILLYREALEYVLINKLSTRRPDNVYSLPAFDRLRDYFYATSNLVVNSVAVQNIVEREIQLNEKNHN